MESSCITNISVYDASLVMYYYRINLHYGGDDYICTHSFDSFQDLTEMLTYLSNLPQQAFDMDD